VNPPFLSKFNEGAKGIEFKSNSEVEPLCWCIVMNSLTKNSVKYVKIYHLNFVENQDVIKTPKIQLFRLANCVLPTNMQILLILKKTLYLLKLTTPVLSFLNLKKEEN
jgi:hypothetical protein